MKMPNVPEPPDSQRVTFKCEIDATIGELREREAKAQRAAEAAMKTAFAGGALAAERAEQAIRAWSLARFHVQVATAYAQLERVTDALLDQYRTVCHDPLKAWLGTQRRGKG